MSTITNDLVIGMSHGTHFPSNAWLVLHTNLLARLHVIPLEDLFCSIIPYIQHILKINNKHMFQYLLALRCDQIEVLCFSFSPFLVTFLRIKITLLTFGLSFYSFLPFLNQILKKQDYKFEF